MDYKLGKVARPERFELPTNWFEASYSIQLSYGRSSESSQRVKYTPTLQEDADFIRIFLISLLNLLNEPVRVVFFVPGNYLRHHLPDLGHLAVAHQQND